MGETLGALLHLTHPATLRRLWSAGMVEPGRAIGLATSVPWLLGRGPTLGVASLVNAVAEGPKPALHDRSGSLTWEELDRRTNRLANTLAARDVGAGDRVATLLRNGREQVEVLLATQKIGAVAAPLNTWSKPPELRASLEGSRPRMLVYDTRHAEQAGEAAPEDLPLVAAGDPSDSLPGSLAYRDLLGPRADPPSPLGPRGGGVVIQTSGTTGRPKGAARGLGAEGARQVRGLLSVVPFRSDDVILCPAPLFHSFGLLTAAVATLMGATLVLPDAFDPEETVGLVERHRATVAALVPVMIRRVVGLPSSVRGRHDVSSLRIVLASGSAIPEDLRESAKDTFGDVLYDLYGSTEAGWVTIATPEDMARRPGSVGRPVAGVEVAILSREGDPLPPGSSGEIHVRSPARFEGYTSGEDVAERGGFLSLGDVGRMDDDGYLFVEGRADDMVVIGGENVYPLEVEEVIRRVRGVEDVAVVPVEDEEYGRALAAFVAGSATEEAVRRRCRSDLASFKVPRRIEIVDDLPRTGTGKIRRGELTAS